MSTSQNYVNVCCCLEDSSKLAQEELQKSQKRYKKHYDKKAKPRCLEVGDQVLMRPGADAVSAPGLLLPDSSKLLMQRRGRYFQ